MFGRKWASVRSIVVSTGANSTRFIALRSLRQLWRLYLNTHHSTWFLCYPEDAGR